MLGSDLRTPGETMPKRLTRNGKIRVDPQLEEEENNDVPLRVEAAVTPKDKARFSALKALLEAPQTLIALVKVTKCSQKDLAIALKDLVSEEIVLYDADAETYAVNAGHPRYAAMQDEIGSETLVTPNKNGTFNIRSMK